MSVVGYKARNYPQQVSKRGARPEVDDRATTWEDFRPLHKRFRFSIDVAASTENAKLERYYSAAVDGLAQSWAGERVWCNPPYSYPNLGRWAEKAWDEWFSDHRPELIVMLVPANRTEQDWWHRYVEPFRDRATGLRVEFLSGRIRFLRPGATEIGPKERPPFSCCLLIWGEAS